ncbi:MAG: hypothetical protein RLZZ175_2756 [Bacteroidota bacterium]|jgi:hypothetical protein
MSTEKDNIPNQETVSSSEDAEILNVIKAADSGQDFEMNNVGPRPEDAGFNTQVNEREYAINPESQLNNIDSDLKKAPAIEDQQEVVEHPKKAFAFPEFTKQIKEVQTPAIEEKITPSESDVSERMQFEDIPDMPSNAQSLNEAKGEMGVRTSDFIWKHFKNGFPNLMGTYVLNIDTKIVEKYEVDTNLKLEIASEIEAKNKQTKQKLSIPDDYDATIKPALDLFCEEKGIQAEISPTVQLLVGVGLLIAAFIIPTVMEIKKSNDLYLRRLDQKFKELEERNKAKE